MKVLGLDLGQTHDYSAAVVLDVAEKLVCTAIRRWELGADYTQVVEDVLDFPYSIAVVDFTGVGRPVVDLLRKRAGERRHEGRVVPVTLTTSRARPRRKEESRGFHYSIPKVEVITSIALAQQMDELRLPDNEDTQ